MTTTAPTVVLISGANRGIGLATASQLAKDHGYHVIIGARDATSGEKEAATLVTDGFLASAVHLDVTSEESIAAAVAWIDQKFGKLDVLINNAGILIDATAVDVEANRGLSTKQIFDKTFATNVIGTACLTEACVPLLRKAENPRLIFVSTRMGSLAESIDKSRPWYNIDYKIYDSSKAAMNMLAVNYARILSDVGAMVNIACPGLVKTNLTRYIPMGTSTEVGARRIIQLATAKKGGPTATFSDINGAIQW